MFLRLLVLFAASELLYLALALRSAFPASEGLLATWYGPLLYEETIEFFAIWTALWGLYALAIRASRGRESGALSILIWITSAVFHASVLLGSGFDHERREFFLHGENPLAHLVETAASGHDAPSFFPWWDHSSPVRAAVASIASLAALALAPGLLRAAGLPTGLALLHGWNPLVIKEASGSGRLETVALFFLVLVFRLVQQGRTRSAAFAYGASLTGPLALAASVPVLVKALRGHIVVSLGIAGSAWALFAAGRGWREALGWPPESFIGGSLMPSAATLSRFLVSRDPLVALYACLGIWLLVAISRSRKTPEARTLPRETLMVLAALIFLSPQVLPWAFLPFAYLAPYSDNRAFLLFTATAPLTYLAVGGGSWNFWLGFTQYFPPFASLVFIWLGKEGNSSAR